MEAPARKRTFTETARRAQIVAAAIDTLAELGYAQTSLARIAERLEISKGVILYHFDSKDELVKEIVDDIVTRAEAYMRPRIQAAPPGVAKLRAYIEANLGFIAAYRNDTSAIVEISRSHDTDRNWMLVRSVLDKSAADLQQLLRRLQESNELRSDLDAAVVALAIRGAIDAAVARLRRDPGLDIERYGRELATLFDSATRRLD
jgi:AcrR family transcriptional regulator